MATETKKATTTQVMDELLEGIRRKFEPKHFKSGKTGFGAYGKLEVDGKRYQLSVNVVELE